MDGGPDILRLAIAHFEAGRLAESEGLCRQVLQSQPANADAWNLLGMIAYRAGNHEAARACVEQAIQRDPNNAVAVNTLGLLLQEQNQLEEAMACFRRALNVAPDFYLALANLGSALKAQGNLDEAIACYRRALNLAPSRAELHNNLGAALSEQLRLNEAAACYREAVRLDPNYAEAYSNLGAVLFAQLRLEEAEACCRRAVELKPDFTEALQNLGAALREREMPEEAADCYRRAVAITPDNAEALNGLGAALVDAGKLADAEPCFRRAIELNPSDTRFYTGLANSLREQGRLDEAAQWLARAEKLQPHDAVAHYLRANLMLLRGEFRDGWTEYEWRWKTGTLALRDYPFPRWEGESLNGRSILLWAEQGLGDTMQFIRYAEMVKEQGATVIAQCQKPLVKLLARCRGIDRLFSQGNELPPFDVQIPLMSLPRIFGTTLDSIPARVPYLNADPALIEQWRQMLMPVSGIRIGINWAGCTAPRSYKNRDIPLEHFAALAAAPGVRMISLQKGEAEPEVQSPKSKENAVDSAHPAIVDFGDELDREHGAFMDTAAIMMNLDLVITSDTSVAHLAGALGVPVWVALPLVPDWRWLLERSDSPWYPTMRLFRQKSRGDWAGVFQEIEVALRERLEKR